jgi:hypothetical protein
MLLRERSGVCVCSIRTLNHHARIRVTHRTDREREREKRRETELDRCRFPTTSTTGAV